MDTDRSTVKQGFLLSKIGINQRTKIHFILTRYCANCILRGKKIFCTYCIQLYLFDFSLKKVINQQFAPLKEGLGWCIAISLMYQLYLFRSLLYLLLKNTLFLMLLVVRMYLCYNCIVIKEYFEILQKVTRYRILCATIFETSGILGEELYSENKSH